MSNHFSANRYDATVLCLVMCYRSHKEQTVYSICTSFRTFIILCVYVHTGLYATCSSFVVQILSEYTNQLLHLDPHADWQDGRRDFFATFDLILFHSHTVKHQIICLCHILRNNTNTVCWIITSQETSHSTAYDMRNRHNKWEVCLVEHTASHLLYHHFNSEAISCTFDDWNIQ